MNVERAGEPIFTLTVSQREMRLLVVAMDMLGTVAYDTPAYPLGEVLRGEFDDLFYTLTDEDGLADEETSDIHGALGIESKGGS